MNGLQIVIKACNLPTLWLGVASVAAGCASALVYGYMEVFPAILCLIFVILAQCTGNIGHRYYDELNGYGENLRDGMSFEDEDGRPVIYCLKEGLKVSASLTCLAGLGLLVTAGWWTLIPGSAIMVINWMNNNGKHPWSRSLLYPLVTFFLFGPIAVISTDSIVSVSANAENFTLSDLRPALVMSATMGLMAFNFHIIYRAANAMLGIGVSKSFTREYGVKIAAGIVSISTLLYTAILGAAPMEIAIYTGYSFLILPFVSMLISFLSIYWLIKSPDPSKAWHISLVNIVMVGLASLFIFWFIGLPDSNSIPPYDLLNLL